MEVVLQGCAPSLCTFGHAVTCIRTPLPLSLFPLNPYLFNDKLWKDFLSVKFLHLRNVLHFYQFPLFHGFLATLLYKYHLYRNTLLLKNCWNGTWHHSWNQIPARFHRSLWHVYCNLIRCIFTDFDVNYLAVWYVLLKDCCRNSL